MLTARREQETSLLGGILAGCQHANFANFANPDTIFGKGLFRNVCLYMRKIIIQKLFYTLVLLGCCQLFFSQSAKINGIIRTNPNGMVSFIRPAYPFILNHVNLGYQQIALNNKGAFSFSVDLHEPEIMTINIADKTGTFVAGYNLFLSPGDRLSMEVSGKQPDYTFTVTGKGAANNQLLAVTESFGIERFYGDTLPGRAIAYLDSQYLSHEKIVSEYIQRHHPSADFETAWKVNLRYEVLEAYFAFENNNALRIDDAYARNHNKWFEIRRSLLNKAPLVNDTALAGVKYKQFLEYYLLRTKERLWDQFENNRTAFLQEWYGKDTAAGAISYAEDHSNDLQQRIIEKNFTGKPKEYLYAILISKALLYMEIKNLLPVYNRFRSQFPSSSYLQLFEGPVQEIASRQEQKLSPEMQFIDPAGNFKKWDEVLAYFKGKTVLLDMWGTWCGPCRSDLDKHSAIIHQHFKGTELNFLYIANYENAERINLWRELIAFFNLSGYHTIANEELTKDIMEKVQIKGEGESFPTYVIIHKSGTFEQYPRGFELDRDRLIAKLENVLAE
jgi:thiol-disulfide isomerase/thioredoxin